MANEEHIAILKQGVDAWNQWRRKNPGMMPNLSVADLNNMYLAGIDFTDAILLKANLFQTDLFEGNLSYANLSGANLSMANLTGVNLKHAKLIKSNLTDAELSWTELSGADLGEADLSGAKLCSAILRLTNVNGANLKNVRLLATVLSLVNLADGIGLESCKHLGPYIIDHRTLEQSGKLPLVFSLGCGLPDSLIEYLPSLLNESIQFYSCFISYSSKDQEFVERLHADLQNKGVRCWFAPEDLQIGDKLRITIDESIRLHDKLLLVLSEHSLMSDWV
jgi:TIR domain-containing protein/pentapeptide repeat protein